MRSRAVWRERADDPKGGLGWILRDLGGPLHLLGRELTWTIRFFAAPLLVRGEWFPTLVLLWLSNIPELVLDALGKLRPIRWLSGEQGFVTKSLPIQELLTLPPPATPYPCAIDVRSRGTLLGRDAGIVTFVDGWLHFEGRRTSFAIRRSDVDRRSGERLVLVEGGEVEFEPQNWLKADGLLETDLGKRFKASLESWIRSGAPAGDSLLPPSTAHPTGVARARSQFWTSVFVGTGLVLFCLEILKLPKTSFLVCPFVIGSLKALRDLRRVSPLRRPKRGLPRTGTALDP